MGRTLVKVTFLATIVILVLTTTTSSVMAQSEPEDDSSPDEDSPPNYYYYGEDSYEYLEDTIADQDLPQDLVDQEQTRAKRLVLKAKRSPKKLLGAIKNFAKVTESHITFSNSVGRQLHLQCGKDKHSSSNERVIINNMRSYTWDFKPGSTSSTNTLWCTAMAESKLLSFAAYGSGAPTAKRINYRFNNNGLYHDGKLKERWV